MSDSFRPVYADDHMHTVTVFPSGFVRVKQRKIHFLVFRQKSSADAGSN